MKVDLETGDLIRPEDLGVFSEYCSTFVQRHPRYVIKMEGGQWKTKKKSLSDPPIKAHLRGRYWVGVLGKWYPGYAILDIDDRSMEVVEEIKAKLGLDSNNSTTYESERQDSYHILMKPFYNGRPPTVRLLQEVFRSFALNHGIEIYPQPNRCMRLPFGRGQNPVDFEYLGLTDWTEKFYWFNKLNEFDLHSVKDHQLPLPLESEGPRFMSTFQQGQELLRTGLQYPSSRNEAQFKVIYYLWRLNIPQSEAVEVVWSWINKKHNGHSKDIIKSPRVVRREIERQTATVYGRYDLACVYPDETHNSFNGYITKPDLMDIAIVSKGNLPRMKFLFHLVKYFYPRRHRTFIPVHTDKLQEWSSWRSYQKWLGELEEKGLISRSSSYLIGKFSKNLRLNWKWRSSSDAVFNDGRSVDTFEDSVRMVYKHYEFRQILRMCGVGKQTIGEMIKRIYENGKSPKKEEHI